MVAHALKEYLDRHAIKYVMIIHSPAYTAQEVAQSVHVPGRELAKTVIVNIEGRLAMAVLPANRKVVLQDLRDVTGTDEVRFATEAEFHGRFTDCETGAMPPFGNLYGMDVFVEPRLTQDQEITFNAGSHTEAIQMAYADFERLVHPKIVSFSN